MLTIAVDAMGSDHCPKPEVEGALLATKSIDVKVVLVGRQDVLTRGARQASRLAQLPH